jgi:hypothetical protein
MMLIPRKGAQWVMLNQSLIRKTLHISNPGFLLSLTQCILAKVMPTGLLSKSVTWNWAVTH